MAQWGPCTCMVSQKVRLVRSLFFMHGLKVQHIFITSLHILGHLHQLSEICIKDSSGLVNDAEMEIDEYLCLVM